MLLKRSGNNIKKEEIQKKEKSLIKYYANKIIEDGIKNTQEFSYCINFNEYKEKDFIEQYKQEILKYIINDKRVADVIIDKDGFDMVFYTDYCPNYNEEEFE